MDGLLPVINKLQDVFTAVGVNPLQLPQLIVIGSQSAGKSSVLENIVGKDFLPRGNSIVTRRPLILQLVNNSDGKYPLEESKSNEWGEFLHRKNERFYSFRRICDEILRETDRVAGSNKGVSALPLRLTIVSPRVVSLSLVDLPGITKVPVQDQPSDIEQQIRKIVLKYISNPKSIIVAVSPANQDIANSEALKLAREVDPFGKRTLGVLTKLDLMDRGTDALSVLLGKVVPLQLGFVGTINRSQDDINRGISIKEALKNERKFFHNHPVYKSIASRLGTTYLAERLNVILLSHVKACLPEIKIKISSQIAQTEKELRSYGEVIGEDDSKGAHLLNLLSKFRNNYCDALDGKSPDVSLEELFGGARISFVFHEIFSKAIDSIDPFDSLSDRDIRTAIRNVTGPRPSLFVPEVSFELIVKKQIARLKQPSIDCVDLVFDELQRVALQCEGTVSELARFPHLRSKVIETVRSLLRRRVEPTKSMISNMISIELAYINTNHPDFIGGSRAIASLMSRMSGNKKSMNHRSNNTLSEKSRSNDMINNNNSKNHKIRRHNLDDNNNRKNNNRKKKSDGFFGMIFGEKRYKHNMNENRSDNDYSSSGDDINVDVVVDDDDDDEDDDDDDLRTPSPSPLPTVNDYKNTSYKSRGSTEKKSSIKESSFSSNTTTVPITTMSMREVPNRMLAPDPSDRERIETEIIKSLVLNYFEIVKKNIIDHVPKAIMYSLVNQSKQDIQSELIHTLYKPENYAGLLKEAEDIAQQRIACKQLLAILRKALDIVNEIRDYDLSSS